MERDQETLSRGVSEQLTYNGVSASPALGHDTIKQNHESLPCLRKRSQAGISRCTAYILERKMRTNFFCTNLLNTPRGAGHPGKIPGTSQIPFFETQGRQTFGRSPDPKS